MDLERLKQNNKDKQAKKQSDERYAEQVKAGQNLQKTIVESFKIFTEYLDSTTSKTAVVNQLKSIGTPDALKVAKAVDSLHETIKDDKDSKTLNAISKTMRQVLGETKKLPKTTPPIEKQRFIDYSSQMVALGNAVKAVEKAVKNQKTTIVPPKISLPKTNVNVEAPDLSPLNEDLRAIERAVKKIIIPEVTIDLTTLEKELKSQHKTLKDIRDVSGSSGGGGAPRATPYSNSEGIPTFVTLNPDGTIPISSGGQASYSVNDMDDSAATEYYGFTTADATYQIRKVTDSGVSYATISNNSGTADYTTAWSNKTSLTYGRFDEAF